MPVGRTACLKLDSPNHPQPIAVYVILAKVIPQIFRFLWRRWRKKFTAWRTSIPGDCEGSPERIPPMVMPMDEEKGTHPSPAGLRPARHLSPNTSDFAWRFDYRPFPGIDGYPALVKINGLPLWPNVVISLRHSFSASLLKQSVELCGLKRPQKEHRCRGVLCFLHLRRIVDFLHD